jgi:hypothetical protein
MANYRASINKVGFVLQIDSMKGLPGVVVLYLFINGLGCLGALVLQVNSQNA